MPSAAPPASGLRAAWRALRGQAAPPAAQARDLPLPRRGASRSPFVGASIDRLTSSWAASRQSINDELRSDLDRLRDRSREMSRNNAYARKFLHMVARNVVGPSGFVLQARVMDAPSRPDATANAAIEAAFWAWSRRGSAEVSGRMSFADLCRAAMRGVARDGEALVRIVRGADAGNSQGFALQLIDVARLDTERNRAPTSSANAIIMGVEVNRFLRPLAYWIKPSVGASSSSAQRYPADDWLHVFVPESAEQVRGLPWMHAAMIDLHDLGEFNRSALLAARHGADTLGLITTPAGGDVADEVGGVEEIELSEMGTFKALPEGCDVRPLESQYPHQAFEPFTKAILRRISSGFDVSYNALGNDLEGVNFSSIRAGVLEERDEWMLIQNWFSEALLEPVYERWFAHALTAGVIVLPDGAPLPVAERQKYSAHEWQGRRWTWVDPIKDIESARLAIRTGIASPQMVAAQNGVDVEDVIDGIAAFEAMVAAKGVKAVDLGDAPSSPDPAPPPDAGKDGGNALP